MEPWKGQVLNNTGTLLVQALIYITQINKSPSNSTVTNNITLIDNGTDPFFRNDTMVCYGIYGCYSTAAPWKDVGRPVSNLPEPPEKIDTTFCLYTRYNPDTCQILNYTDKNSIYRSFLIPFHKTYFIAHGFLETGERPWMKNMTQSLLRKEDVNVIIIDWGKGSMPPYTQAVANIRPVGRIAAMLIYALRVVAGINTENIHLIGHSLGAHLTGYIGNTLQDRFGYKIGRITALDPAQPHFSATNPVVRLDTTDALFVDAIHTDARPFMIGGLGYEEPIAHYDFYPNSGANQPGCNKGMMGFIKNENQSAFQGVKRFLACDHVRSHEYFLESINSAGCQFLGVECDSWEKFMSGGCFPCQTQENKNGSFCAYLGMDSILTWNKRKDFENRSLVKFYTITNSDPPFCASLYRVTLTISNSEDSIKHKGEVGQFSISIAGGNGKTNVTEIFKEQYFEPGSNHRTVIGGRNVGKISSANLHWGHQATLNFLTWRFDPHIYIGSITIETFVDNQKLTLCPSNDEQISLQKAMKLIPCR